MKLDGDKLLADLEDIIKTLENTKKKAIDAELWTELITMDGGLLTAKEIKSWVINGDYTIKDEK